jgi:hypothetical protein
VPKVKFQGDCEELKGYTFDCSDPRQADMFVKTCKKLGEYIGKMWFCNQGGNVQILVKTLAMPIIHPPADIDETTATSTEKAILKKKIEIFVQREMALEEKNRAMYALVMGQCTETMRAKLEAQQTFEVVDSTLNGLDLLVTICDLVCQFHSQKYLPHSIHEAMRRLVTFQQGKGVTAATYLEQFQNLMEVVTHTQEHQQVYMPEWFSTSQRR